ncbi:PREDICTED: uncharacterized protein LOC108759240 [Trachymyrmex cornetzi]|uniref:uncharacterized protein LOC108759240 n=1 Tax=Trachymyrmex cornetzi TaxID=471704 RepID=UPI00084EFF46|nr:PREDICTED: uncharacterized protein LOC108759240 [Trachymyrmex cornetzi]
MKLDWNDSIPPTAANKWYALNQALAAVVYACSITCDGHVGTQLICAKSKMAPLKLITIPILELAEGTLLVKLVTHILKSLNHQSIPIHLWTDSSIAHTWIANHSSRWKDFVHNRVCYIQESLPQAKWGLVPGYENPTDLATRGMSPIQLSEQLSWWKGPSWLSQLVHQWPQQSPSTSTMEFLEEQKTTLLY